MHSFMRLKTEHFTHSIYCMNNVPEKKIIPDRAVIKNNTQHFNVVPKALGKFPAFKSPRLYGTASYS